MLNRLKEETAARILQETSSEGPISRTVVDSSDIPDSLKQFLLRMLDRQIELAVRDAFSEASRWYESDSAVSNELLSELTETARESARYPEEHWMPAVRRAADLVVRYAVRPVETLTLFAFGVDGEFIESVDLRRCVRFFRDHRPVRRSVIHFLDGHPTDPVAREDFDEGMRHFLERLTGEYDARQWNEALDPLQELTAFSGLKAEGVPVEGAVILFDHLGLKRVADRIEEEAGRRGAVFVKRKTLEQLVSSELSIEAAWGPASADDSEWAPKPGRSSASRTGASDADDGDAQPGPGTNGGASDSAEDEPEAVETVAETAATGAESGDVPLWKQFQPGTAASKADQLQRSEAPLWEAYREDVPTTGADIAGKLDDGSEADTAHAESSDGLENLEQRLLGDTGGDRARFIRILFKGDRESYAETLAMIGEVSSWTQASKILSRRVFKKYDVDIYGDAAVQFTDAIEKSFGDAA